MKTLTEENYETIKSAAEGLSIMENATAQDLRHAAELHVSLSYHHISCVNNLLEKACDVEVEGLEVIEP
ncbi:MAG: hypothetical protein KAV87_53130 [Desulfobacteraceae bacterium]|nr:hypothetical protein [Desulfobacteraceae bacterium]